MPEPRSIVLETSQDVLAFDPLAARLISFRSQAAPAQEFIAFGAGRARISWCLDGWAWCWLIGPPNAGKSA